MSEMSIKKATIINAVSKYGKVIINLVFTAVLSRILSPSDYGIVAMVTVFTSFFNILSDMGLGSAVVQNKEITDKEVNDIFSFSCYQGIFLSIIFAGLSVPISLFYKNSVYLPICGVLAISVFFNTLNMIPNAILMKSKKFVIVAIRNIITTLLTGGTTIFLALLGFKYYALVIQSVVSAVIIFFWNLKSVNLKFSFRYDKKSVEKVKDFSIFQFAYNFVNYLSRNMDNLLIGKIMGNEALAYYNKGYTLMLYPIQNFTFVITPILHPILSDYQNDRQYIYEKYVRITKLLSLVGVFVSAYSFFASREIVLLIFGDQWEASVTSFRILSISIWSQMISSTAGSIFMSLDKTKIMFKSGFIQMAVTVTMIIVGCLLGKIEYVALFVTTGLIIKFFIEFYFLIRYAFDFSIVKFLTNYLPDLLIFLILILQAFIINYFIHIDNLIVSALFKFSLDGVVYLFLVNILKQKNFLKMILPKKFRSR